MRFAAWVARVAQEFGPGWEKIKPGNQEESGNMGSAWLIPFSS